MTRAPTPSAKSAQLPHRWVAAFVITLTLAVIASLAWKVTDSRPKELSIARAELQLQAQSMSQALEGIFVSAEQTLSALALQIEASPGAPLPALNLRRRLLRSADLQDLRFYSANGQLLERASLAPLPGTTLPAWVTTAQNAGRPTGWGRDGQDFVLFRTVRANAGQLLGTALASVDDAYFLNMAQQTPGLLANVSLLVGPDLQLILSLGATRTPAELESTLNLLRHSDSRLASQGSGCLELGDQLLVIQQLRSQPIRLIQLAAKATAFSQWHEEVLRSGLLAAAAALTAALFLWHWQRAAKDQQRLLADLVASEAFARATLDAVTPHMCVLNRAGEILAVNQSWRSFYDRNPPPQRDISYQIGSNYVQLCQRASGPDSEEAAPMAAGLARVAQGQCEAFELIYPCHSPTEQRWFNARVTRFHDGSGHLLVAHENITERTQALALLQAERDFSARLIDTAASLVMVVDRQGSVSRINAATQDFTGYRFEDMQGQPFFWARFLPPPQRPEVASLFASIMAGELPPRQKNPWVHRDGSQRLFDWSNSLLRDASGQVSHWVTIGIDITDLVQATRDAQAASLAKSRFLATMSHEIRTPMNGILGMAQLLLTPALADSARVAHARTMLNAGRSLMSLLNDVLDFSKIEAGKLEIDLTTVDAQQLLQETQALFFIAANEKGLQLDEHWLGPAGQRYRTDGQRLRQMLGNLLGNAIKFTARGQVGIEARELSRQANTAQLEFAVTDTGIGIAADKLDLLFKPFSQTDNSTARQFGGSGLGLSIVQSLSHLLGGQAGVESQPGLGSRFWFRIPVELLGTADDGRAAPRATASAPLRPAERAGKAVDRDEFERLAAALRPMLADNKFDAIASTETLAAQLADTALADAASAMLASMNQFDFALTLQRLNQIADTLASPPTP